MQRNNKITKKQALFGILVCFVGAIFYCYEFVLRIIPGALQTELSTAFRACFCNNIRANFSTLLFCIFAHADASRDVDGSFWSKETVNVCLFMLYAWFLDVYLNLLHVSSRRGRFLVGFGSSFAFVGVLSLALHWLPRRYFSLVAGLITTLGMLGLVYGEVKITEWSESMGWEYVLLLIAVMGQG